MWFSKGDNTCVHFHVRPREGGNNIAEFMRDLTARMEMESEKQRGEGDDDEKRLLQHVDRMWRESPNWSGVRSRSESGFLSCGKREREREKSPLLSLFP